MLGRTANGLFWMFRYIERAENIARLVDAGLRMSLTRTGASDDDWDAVLQSADVRGLFDKRQDKVTASDAIDFLLRDTANPSSVMSCIEAGRNNARMVRTALTRETWEATNECWIELKQMLARKLKSADLPEVIDTVKRRAGLIRGAFHGSMLRNEIYNFARIGTFIERADNTSRILDVKYYVLLPAITHVGSSLDNM
ncbi:MAG: alpha-E domain-containing protein, partial [Allorhizobium sp.]